ncbi:helix-turn-helix domain-containing protein [uncultured Hyphomonas sp.]|uniref:helix-turn-helix domain-containing protein n=1 Tax=uncultured Hyphomonas sp. TaxID=225298 RepID=UPI003748B86A
MAHKPNWRAIRIHRSYSVDEAARTLGVAKVTVRRWIRRGGLHVIDDCKPTLILGAELSTYVKRRRSPKHKCRLDQCYCMRCREPKAAALAEAELIQSQGASAMVRMLCETCATVMHKRISWKQVPQLSALVSLSGVQPVKHLSETTQPCVNDHCHKEV